mmetsp:Transcript_18036/g.53794  ORF Transcript_18036/g.53794 Transcript_18036/m.53794 type:complete len:219 (-) Transcript_18036:125-781(-)
MLPRATGAWPTDPRLPSLVGPMENAGRPSAFESREATKRSSEYTPTSPRKPPLRVIAMTTRSASPPTMTWLAGPSDRSRSTMAAAILCSPSPGALLSQNDTGVGRSPASNRSCNFSWRATDKLPMKSVPGVNASPMRSSAAISSSPFLASLLRRRSLCSWNFRTDGGPSMATATELADNPPSRNVSTYQRTASNTSLANLSTSASASTGDARRWRPLQ